MTHLAALLADFHQQHRLPADTSLDLAQMESDFADLFSFTDDLISLRAPDAANKMLSWQSQIPVFLHTHAQRLQARQKSGFWVDGHGDLHSRNIFLPVDQPPVVFDCLEFNVHFRQSDILNELAFFCMDLEYYGRKDLAEYFLKAYNSKWNCFEQPEDHLLFTYFKAYRANIRLKVTLLQLRQHPKDAAAASVALKYWELMRGYLSFV
jgi:aminoglycoside phosphotransferase family enzyme